jgi:precorrin-6B methylase 2
MKEAFNNIYFKSLSDGVWQRAENNDFAYSDGDEVEGRIASVIANASDLSVLSMELRSSIIDWPSNYHLSAQRANLMRPLRSLLTKSVLEIGSGCGAVTRFLGETAAEVVALEGSRRRAHITRSRTRDLTHVEVYCDEFSAFRTERKFDAVTLIGVLEYAHMFVGGKQPALQMLEKAKQRLNDNGQLVIAIENQLGLKYFAGALEDHLGKPMLGLEDGYLPGGVRTYGKRELTSLLNEAGFEAIEFLYPFPDFKMPVCVLSEQAFDNPSFDPTPFLISSAGKDPQLPAVPVFCMERVWPIIAANRIASDVSNSFLIVARQRSEPDARYSGNTSLAWHYSTQRQPTYCKETIFSQNHVTSGIKIERRPIAGLAFTSDQSSPFTHSHEDETQYANVPLLSETLVARVTRTNWTDQQIADFVLLYAEKLTQISGIELVRDGKVRWDLPLPGTLLDCIPQNIQRHSDGLCNAFDLEWRIEGCISFAYLVFRSLWHTIGGLSVLGVHASGKALSLLDIILNAIRLAGKDITLDEAKGMVESELVFLATVTGKTLSPEDTWDWLKNGTQRQHRVYESLYQFQNERDQLSLVIKNSEEALALYKQDSENLTQKAELLEQALRETQVAAQQQITIEQELRQKQMQELELARLESLKSSGAIYRLAQHSAAIYLLRRSAKNIIKQARDYRAFLENKRSSLNRHLLDHFKALGSAALYHWHARPMVIAIAQVTNAQQAIHLMKQSCHWTLPFEWHFIVSELSDAQVIASTAEELGIKTVTTVSLSGSKFDLNAVFKSAPAHALIALPRLVSTSWNISHTDWPLVDATQIRKAYVALLCEQSTGGIYVGTTAFLQRTALEVVNQPIFCIFRLKELQRINPGTTVLQHYPDVDSLRGELAALSQLRIVEF